MRYVRVDISFVIKFPGAGRMSDGVPRGFLAKPPINDMIEAALKTAGHPQSGEHFTIMKDARIKIGITRRPT